MPADWKENYAPALDAYLASRSEGAREAAYELGRSAIDQGLGLLELSQAHRELLGPSLQRRPPGERAADALAAAEFFSECAAPFEMLLRGFREANQALKNMNHELEKRVAERTRDLESRARDLAKSNEDLDRFAALASHDLQEPLRLVAVHVSILEHELGDSLDEKARDGMARIRSGCNRMRDRLNALLSYSRIRQSLPAIKLVSGEAAFHFALSNLASEIRDSGATIDHEPLPLIHSSMTVVSAIFEALLSNALKFRDSRAPQVTVSNTVRDGETVFCVKDNGIGIDKAYWSKIFVIFQRLHSEEKYPGTGAGLAICRRLAENQGGKVWVDASKEGEGSTFCFTLPAQPL